MKERVECTGARASRSARRRALARMGVGLLGAALVLGMAQPVSSLTALARTGEIAVAGGADPARAWPARPLPREWQWRPPTVSYEHMFAQPREREREQ